MAEWHPCLADVYSDRLDQMELPEEIRLLIDHYVSEQNALGSQYGMPAYLLVFSRLQRNVFRKMPISPSTTAIISNEKPIDKSRKGD